MHSSRGILRWFLSLVLVATLFCNQSKRLSPPQAAELTADPYVLSFVKSAFEAYRDSEKLGMSSGQMKHFTYQSPSLLELGDRVSIAALKLYSLDDLTIPENAMAYIKIVIVSFSDRDRVLYKSDQDPRVTSILIDLIKSKEGSYPVLQRKLEYAKECARNFACSVEGIDYFNKHSR